MWESIRVKQVLQPFTWHWVFPGMLAKCAQARVSVLPNPQAWTWSVLTLLMRFHTLLSLDEVKGYNERSSSWIWVLNFQNKSLGFGNLRSAYFHWWKLTFKHDLTELWHCLSWYGRKYSCFQIHALGITCRGFFFLETRWPIINRYDFKLEYIMLNTVQNTPQFKHL